MKQFNATTSPARRTSPLPTLSYSSWPYRTSLPPRMTPTSPSSLHLYMLLQFKSSLLFCSSSTKPCLRFGHLPTPVSGDSKDQPQLPAQLLGLEGAEQGGEDPGECDEGWRALLYRPCGQGQALRGQELPPQGWQRLLRGGRSGQDELDGEYRCKILPSKVARASMCTTFGQRINK